MAKTPSGGMRDDGATTTTRTTKTPDRHSATGRFTKRTTTRTSKRSAKRS